MNKLIFLSGLLTALLFIGTVHGGPNEEISELEQQMLQAMMQDMETIDEEDNEIASVEGASAVIGIIKKYGCTLAKLYCAFQDRTIAKKQGWIRFRAIKDAILGVATKDNFCKAVKLAC